MKRLLAALCLLASVLGAAEPTDLGQGLSYLRIHSIAGSEADLRKAAPATGALVLDLRYATVNDAAPAILQASLANRPASALLLILVSPATPASLAPAIAASSALTLGAPESVPTPKVVVHTDSAADRKAFDALDTGTELTKLITGRIEKERFDEASLVKEFKDGNHDPEPPPAVDPTAPKKEGDTNKDKDAPAAVPTDRVLQRAIQLHRALLALKVR